MAYLIKDSTKWLDGEGENVYLKVLRQVEQTNYFPFAMKEYGYKKQQVGSIELYINESGNKIFVHPKSPSYYLNLDNLDDRGSLIHFLANRPLRNDDVVIANSLSQLLNSAYRAMRIINTAKKHKGLFDNKNSCGAVRKKRGLTF